MEHRKLGTTGLKVSAMSVGSFLTLDHVEEEVGLEVLREAIDGGVNFFDDARYDDRTGKAPMKTGYSEVVFGELFRKGGWRREDFIFANKAWLEFYPDETIAEEIEGSLVRLQVDYLDIVYAVPPSKEAEISMEALVDEMNGVVQSGKVRYWGGLNWNGKQIGEAQAIAEKKGYPPFAAVQLPYNLLYRKAVESRHTRAACERHGVSVVASFGLNGGLLTNKYAAPEGLKRGRMKPQELAYYGKRGGLRMASKLADVADELGMTPAQLALAYCLRGPHVASVLFGATSGAQVGENLAALEAQQKLDAEALGKIGALFKKKSG